MDFLRYNLMVSNRVSVDLDSYEFGPDSTKTSPSDLHTVFLELATRTLLVGWIMGDELMRKDYEGVEKLKADLESSAASLQSALSANISLAGRNKDLEEQLEQVRAEAALLQEICSVATQKEEQANQRVTELRDDVKVLEEKVSSLRVGREEDGLRIAGLEAELGKLQNHVIEQHDMGFELAVNHKAFFYRIPTNEGKFDNRKAFYKGELLPLADILEDDDIGAEGEAGGGATEDSPVGEGQVLMRWEIPLAGRKRMFQKL